MATTPAMSETAMRELHEAHVAAENRGDLKAALDLYTDDCYLQHVSLGFRVEGREAMAGYYDRVQAVFPDKQLVFEGESYGENLAVAWGNLVATVGGPFLGVESTTPGARVSVPHIVMVTFRDGMMHGEHLVVDVATLCALAGFDLLAVLAAAAHAPYPKRDAWDGLPTFS
jgi:catechol 2,3-dioxygenase-like lactoylglutathione lyase family enzyme